MPDKMQVNIYAFCRLPDIEVSAASDISDYFRVPSIIMTATGQIGFASSPRQPILARRQKCKTHHWPSRLYWLLTQALAL